MPGFSIINKLMARQKAGNWLRQTTGGLSSIYRWYVTFPPVHAYRLLIHYRNNAVGRKRSTHPFDWCLAN